MSATRSTWTVFKLGIARLRFIAIFVIAALVVGYWDPIKARFDKWTRPPGHFEVAAAHDEWYCPMHPQVVRSQPGQCPICNMDLKKREQSQAGAKVPDRVQLSPYRLALANVATTQASFRTLTREVRALGVLDYDETRLANISARVAGRADELYLTWTGQPVKAGEGVYSLYSPEVFTAQREYLQARKRVNDLPADAPAEVRADASAVYNASMQKLVLWGISREQLDKLDQDFDATGKVPTHFTVTSPIGGTVVRKEINPGQYLQVGQTAYTVADLSTLWLKAKLYESDIPLVKVGQRVEVQVEAMPNERVEARVTYLAFALDPQTRTLDARIEVPNKDQRLRPGMFATALIKAPAVPTTAPATTTQATARATAQSETAKLFERALESYLRSSDLLAHDKSDGVSALLTQTVQTLSPIEQNESLRAPYARLATAVKQTPRQDIAHLRETFKGVSLALIDIAKTTGQPTDAATVQIFRCPMGDKPYWLQPTGDAVNPYMGLRMLDCGIPVEPLPKSQPLQAQDSALSTQELKALAIPRSAVIDTGTRKIVFVQSSVGVFDARAVTLGALSSDDFYPVLSGLKENDQVVTTGAFLLDSENRLNPVSSTIDK
jgi:multidrug efflux pump subunit AcrA (membrane-fusion protein)